MAIMSVNLFSICLKQNMDVTVVLPDEIAVNEKLPCIWLYHGGSGDQLEWLHHTPLVDIVNEHHFAAVLPNVLESCFINMNIGDAFGTYVGKELPATIWNMYDCISKEREDNYIVGLSNGGYGCFQTAFTYPEKFSMIGAFSAGDKADAIYEADGSPKALQRERLFGDGDLHGTEYSFLYRAEMLREAGRANAVKIYHACGSKDPWLKMNHIVRDYFLEHLNEFDYTYDEMEDYGHEWPFWKEELLRFLDFAKGKAKAE